MARATKDGLDYFALDVRMNDEAELIEAEHGLAGFAIMIKLFQKIYSEGYYYPWGERQQLLFSKRVSTDRNVVASVVSDCLKWGIFNQVLYDQYGILTSRRIQNHYVSATYKRSEVVLITEYLLIDVIERANIRITTRCNTVSDTGNEAASIVSDVRNSDTSTVADIRNEQSKVKYSKVKESKEDIQQSAHEVIILTADEEKFINILSQIHLYPLDRKRDVDLYHSLQERYPELDLAEAAEYWRAYKMDKPLTKSSNPRSQINNSFKKYLEWGKCLKGDSHGADRRDSKKAGKYDHLVIRDPEVS